jgi:hypothetical protein
MNDADPTATGYPPREESAPHDMSGPDPKTCALHETAGEGGQGHEYPARPGPGGADAWPSWPGVARPAGWFLEAAREAAPLAATSTEPARPAHPGSYPPVERPPAAAGARPAGEQDYRARGGSAAWPGPRQPGGDQPDYGPPGPDWPGHGAAGHGEPGHGGPGHGAPRYDDEEDADAGYPPAWREPVVGPTEALHGRAGGPGFRVPAGAGYGVQDPANRSGWQIADGLWRDSGISWEDEPQRQAFPLSAPVAEAPAPPASRAREVRPAPPADLRRPTAAPLRPDDLPPQPRYRAQQDYQPYQARQDYRGQQGEPAVRPAADRGQPPGPRPRQRAGWPEPQPSPEPQPWQDQGVPAFPARRRARGRKAWQAARVGVPVGVIIAVGAGALVMLTGKTHEVLARTGSQSPASLAPTAAPAKGKSGPGARPAPLAFPGYPGQRGAEAVSSIASAGGVQVAVGTSGGRAAIWRRMGGGAWSLLTGASAVTQVPAAATLTSVTHGPAGWLAVGDVDPVPFGNSGTAKAPVILASADGGTWQAITGSAAFSGPGFQVNAAASGGGGYVVVGSQLRGGKPVDAMWWSPDLRNWVRGDDTIMTTLSSASSGMRDSAMYAVTATPAGFVAVGTHADCHTAWVSGDGQHWRSYDIPKPPGTQFPLLNHVAAMGNLVVATGDIGANGHRYPLAVTSADGGLHWRGTSLGGSGRYAGPHGTVTAVTADGSGFLAAGLVGQRAVTWTSPDGITWSPGTPASSGTQAITALATEGNAVTQVSTLTATYGYRSVAVTAAGS